jgi:predicted metalloprotease
MRPRVLGLVLVLSVVGAACAVADPGVTSTRSRQGGSGQLLPSDSTPSGSTTPGDTTGVTTARTEPNYDIVEGVIDFGSNKPPQSYDGFLTHAFQDLEKFWSTSYPDTYGEPWKPLSHGVYAAYPDRTDPIPGCGTSETAYADVRGNAFYCPNGDFMAYDDAGLLPSMVDQLGKEAAAIVLAHEFGHTVQNRAGNSDRSVLLGEQQADCFAGAWTAHVASGASDSISFDDKSIRAGLIAMINLRDSVENAGKHRPNAHGTGFDRVGAFQDGFTGGPKRCKTFYDENRKLIDIPFEEDPNNGNLPLVDPAPDPTNGPQDIVTLLPASLDAYWTDLTKKNNVPFTAPKFTAFATDGPYPSCVGIDQGAWKNNTLYCKADNTIYWDQDYALQQDSQIGDMAVGYMYSTAYSDAIQTALRSKRSGEKRALMNDCLTGAWSRFISPPIPTDRENKLRLSAGDLDEAVVNAIVRADPTTDTNKNGSAFEKVSAFRKGVLSDLNECNASFK